MVSKNSFKTLCTPAQIYFGIAVIAAIFQLYNGMAFTSVGMQMLFAFFWTFVLGMLCSNGFEYISWFLVLLPYVVILLTMLSITNIPEYRGVYRSVGLQGAYGKEAFDKKNKDKMY